MVDVIGINLNEKKIISNDTNTKTTYPVLSHKLDMEEGGIYADLTLLRKVERLFPMDPPYLPKQFSSSNQRKGNKNITISLQSSSIVLRDKVQ